MLSSSSTVSSAQAENGPAYTSCMAPQLSWIWQVLVAAHLPKAPLDQVCTLQFLRADLSPVTPVSGSACESGTSKGLVVAWEAGCPQEAFSKLFGLWLFPPAPPQAKDVYVCVC